MLRQRTRTLQAAAALIDAAATTAAFFAAYYGFGRFLERASRLQAVLPLDRYLWVLWLAVPTWWALIGLFGCYDFSPLEGRREYLLRLARPMAVGALALSAAVFFSKELEFARRVVGGFLALNVLFIAAGRVLLLTAAARRHRRQEPLRRVLVIGAGEAARDFGERVRRAGWGLALAGYVAEGDKGRAAPDCLGGMGDLPRILDQGSIDDVVLVGPAGDWTLVQRVIATCEEVGAAIHIPAPFFHAQLSKPHVETFSGVPMLTFSARPYGPLALGVKRAADIVGSIALLVLFSIPMIVIAALVRMTSPGPAIFKQVRSGLYGRPFTMYKFRSMVSDAEQRRATLEAANEMDGPVFKMAADPRITPLGRRLRRHSLDELPQLWNVLKGDMSLIGPRPPLPHEVAQYERWQRRRLSMRPGLTCIWQVTDRNKATFEKWMEYDLQYIDHWSLWLDLKIALKTVPAALKGTGV